jgi:F-type H+-transporting ATPase subunit b
VKAMRRYAGLSLLLAGLLAGPAVRAMHGQTPTAAGQAEGRKAALPNEEHMDAPDTNAQIEGYRHSAVVQSIARTLHVKTETAAQIFEDFNSGVLLLVLAWALVKFLPGMFRNRTEKLGKELSQAHAATEDANRRLAEVEARLSRLDGEIESIRMQAEKDSAEDEKRVQAALESERERIVASAEQEIAAVQAAAQRELKKFAAELAIDHAMRRIQLSTESDRALVREFGAGLKGGGKA